MAEITNEAKVVDNNLAPEQPKPNKKLDKSKDVKKKTKVKKEGAGKKIGRALKETGSELKKVSWPTFRQVCKKTGIVLLVVLLFTVALFGIDQLLSLLFKLLVG